MAATSDDATDLIKVELNLKDLLPPFLAKVSLTICHERSSKP